MTTVFDTAQTEAAKRVAETVLMGSSGSGTTTVALELQRRWDGLSRSDDLHPAANVERCDPAIP